ncbi:MAG: outer membrane beta-barrel protein [Janthinobacterium lividum]
MIKKSLFWLLLAINTVSISASQDTSTSHKISAENKWRVGFSVGAAYSNIEAKVKDNYPFDGYLFNEQKQTHKNLFASPSIEIGKTCYDNFYLGVLASWNHVNSKEKSKAPLRNSSYFQHNLKISHYFDILAKMGYKIDSKKMAYILVGPSFMRWSHTTDQLTDNYRLNQTTKDASFKIDDRTQGLGIGLGFEHVIYNKFILSVTYKYAIYKEKSGQQTMTYRDPKTRPIKNFTGVADKKVKLSSNSLLVSLSYFF